VDAPSEKAFGWLGSPRRLRSGRAGIARVRACAPAREGGRQGCGLTAMEAGGMQVGGVDDGCQL